MNKQKSHMDTVAECFNIFFFQYFYSNPLPVLFSLRSPFFNITHTTLSIYLICCFFSTLSLLNYCHPFCLLFSFQPLPPPPPLTSNQLYLFLLLYLSPLLPRSISLHLSPPPSQVLFTTHSSFFLHFHIYTSLLISLITHSNHSRRHFSYVIPSSIYH